MAGTENFAVTSSLNPAAMAEGGYRRGGAQIGGISAQVAVEGISELKAVFARLEGTVVAATIMTSKLAADGIYQLSQKYVPYNEGFLARSAGEGPFLLEGSDLAGSGKTTLLTQQVEGTADYANAIAVTGGELYPASVRWGRGAVGRAYAKWAVSYNRDGTAWYAEVVHENEMNWKFGQDKDPNPKHHGYKKDHFLSDAFNEIAPVFSQAATQSIRNALDMVQEYAMLTSPKPRPTTAAGAPRLVPRLVKKGG